MTKKLVIPRITCKADLFTDKVKPVKLTEYPWGNPTGYEGSAEFRLGYSDKAFHIAYTVYESIVKATYHAPNDPVSKDSCVEFFFRPDTEAKAPYINIEVNSIGTMLAKHSLPREEGKPSFVYIDRSDDSRFEIETTLSADTVAAFSGPSWQVSYTVPFDIIRGCFPEATFNKGDIIRANFYKCGHATERPHHITWNVIDTPTPQFHSPQCFGIVELGE